MIWTFVRHGKFFPGTKYLHMKNVLSTAILTLLLTSSFLSFSQPPPLGATSSFAIFTATGAFTNEGGSNIGGDIGTHIGAFTGFPPGTVAGQIHVSDTLTLQAALDVNTAYAYLTGQICDTVLGSTLGNNLTLKPGVYCIGAAATLQTTLILNGQGDSNAFFLIKIDGAFSTAPFSNIQLINGASSSNIFWQVNGQVTLGENSSFEGNILANGAIHLLEAASLHGRALSKAGAISLHNNAVYIGASALDLKLFLQEYYIGAGLMDHVLMNQGVAGAGFTLTDTILVEIRNPSTPFAVRYSQKTLLNTDGTAVCNFPMSGTFYIVIKHRNTIQTWSKHPVSLSGLNNEYDFSDAATKAFGDNVNLVESEVYALFTGDINQDENIDLIDLNLQETDINNFAFGYYASDLNGDGNVDLIDIARIEENTNLFIYSQHP